MTDDTNPLQSGLPEDLYQLGSGTNPDADISVIKSDLEAAENIADNVDTDVALDIVTCQQECLQSLDDCNRCVNGQIESSLRSVEDYLDRFQSRIVRPIQEDLSNVISLGTQLGIPITELLPQTATPDEENVAFAETTRPASFLATIPSPTAAAAVQPMAPAAPVSSESASSVIANVTGTSAVRDVGPADIYRYTSPGCVNGLSASPPSVLSQLTLAQTTSDGTKYYVGQADGFYWSVVWSPLRDKDCQWEIVTAPIAPSGTGDGISPPIIPPDTTTVVTVGPAGTGHLKGASFCDPAQVQQIRQQVSSLGIALGSNISGVVDAFASSSGLQRGTVSSLLDIFTNPSTVIGGLMVGAATGVTKAVISAVSSSGLLGSICNDNAFALVSAQNAIANIFGGWFGIVPQQVRTTNQYTSNLICQYLIPSAADANTLWNQGILTDDQWSFVVEANGYCPEWQRKVREALSPVPTVDQVVSLVRRQAIDPSTSDYYFKRLGVKDNADKEAFFALSDFIPGPSDLVSFMTRDVFDPSVVESERLDDEFEDKFQGAIEQWAAAQGMDAEQFRYYWRAHWRYPSPEQLAEFVHRLRPTDRDPDDKYADVVFTVDDFKRLMRINDYAPEHIDEYLATTYRPLSRIDARRAFEIGAVDERGLYRSYLDLGYAPDKARALLDFARLNSGPIRAKKTGSAGTAEVLKWFRERTVTREQAEQLLIESGVPDQYVSKYLRTEELRRTSANRKEAMAALRKRYMTGEFSAGEISSALSGIGVEPNAAGEILFQWEIVRDAKYKGPTVSMLCEWFQRGMIDMAEFQRRVDNMGYSHVDAQRIVQTCLGKRQEQLEKEAEKAAKEAASREAKRIRDLKAAQKDAERAYKAGLPCTPSKPKCKPGTLTPEPPKSANGKAGSSPANP